MTKISFTITTGGRLELFKRTMGSFLQKCLDTDMIDEWLLCDDRSSESDIEEMKRFCPQFKIYRSPKPGQATSLNLLFSQVQNEWFFHCEDDWQFIREGHFIRDMLSVANSDQRIKNIILRHWDSMSIVIGDLRYNGHFYKQHLGFGMMRRADALWYGYSLNPGLQHLPTIKKLGRYDEDFDITDRFWDRPQAIKYFDLGLKRANLIDNYINHIGDKQSAYERNK